MNYKTLLIFIFALMPLISSHAGNRAITIQLGTQNLRVEIADTPEKTQRGLMFRRHLPAHKGMLFVFPTDEIRGFWMKNTYVPLSVAYIDYEGVIREIYDLQPHDLQAVTSRFPFRYALEVKQGLFKKLGVKIGDKIDLSPLFS